MAIVVKFPSRFNETQQEPPRELHGPAAMPAEVIVFPRMSLVDLRGISEAMRADRERQNVVQIAATGMVAEYPTTLPGSPVTS